MQTRRLLTLLLRSAAVLLSVSSVDAGSTAYSWRYYRPGNTGIQGDYNEAIWIGADGDPYIGGYDPFFEEGGGSCQQRSTALQPSPAQRELMTTIEKGMPLEQVEYRLGVQSDPGPGTANHGLFEFTLQDGSRARGMFETVWQPEPVFVFESWVEN